MTSSIRRLALPTILHKHNFCWDRWDENLVIVCWFYAKNCIFEHITDKIFPAIFGDAALQFAPMVDMLELAPGEDLAVCVGTDTASCSEHLSRCEPECGGHDDGEHSRRLLVGYTEQEVLYLMDGVRRFGTSWATILHNYAFHSDITAADIKEKYAKLRKVCQFDYKYVHFQTSRKCFMHQAGSSAPVYHRGCCRLVRLPSWFYLSGASSPG